MIPFISPNLYNQLKKLPTKELAEDANYYDWMEDIWKYVEPSYDAFASWALQRCEGEITDLGCGNGVVGKKLNAKYFYDFIKSFPEVELIDLTSNNLPKLKGDTFILSHVLEHLPNPKQTLNNLFDKFDSNNKVLICVPDGGNLESTALPFQQYIPSNDATYKHKHHLYSWTASDLFNTLVQGGWEDVEISFANISGFATIWAMAKKP